MATIDPSIPLAVKQPQIQNPLAAFGELAQLQGTQQQNALLGLKMQQLQTQMQQDEAVRQGLAQPGADPAQVLLRAGRPKEAVEFSAAQRAKEKADLETAMTKLKMGAQFLSTAKDQPSYDAARQQAQAAGLDITRMPPQFDPAFVANSLKQSMDVHQQMEQEWKKADYDLRVRGQASTERHQGVTEAQQAATAEEQRRHNRATEEGAAATLSKPYEVTDQATGQNILVRQDKAGNTVPVPGYGPKGGGKPLPEAALKKITEVRDNAITIDRLNNSFKDDFAGKGILGFGADTQLRASGVVGADQDAVQWWKDYRKQAELVERHAMFGAALSQGEQASWRSADIDPGMDKETIKRNLAERARLAKQVLNFTRQDLIDAGHPADRVNAIASRSPEAAAPAPGPGGGGEKIHTVKTPADYAKVPPGEMYTAPDGVTRRKPKVTP